MTRHASKQWVQQQQQRSSWKQYLYSVVICVSWKFLNTKKIGFFVQMGNYYIQQSSEINLVSCSIGRTRVWVSNRICRRCMQKRGFGFLSFLGLIRNERKHEWARIARFRRTGTWWEWQQVAVVACTSYCTAAAPVMILQLQLPVSAAWALALPATLSSVSGCLPSNSRSISSAPRSLLPFASVWSCTHACRFKFQRQRQILIQHQISFDEELGHDCRHCNPCSLRLVLKKLAH